MSDQTHKPLDDPHRGDDGPAAARGSFRGTQLIIPYLLFQLVNRLSSSMLEHARPLGITVARFRVLAQLVESDGMRIRDLVRECAAEQSAMSRIVDQLERDGMVSRKAGSGDNRAVTVWITPKGRETYEAAFPHALDAVKELTGDLSAAEIRQLIGLLQRMIDSAGIELLPAPCFRSAASIAEAGLEGWACRPKKPSGTAAGIRRRSRPDAVLASRIGLAYHPRAPPDCWRAGPRSRLDSRTSPRGRTLDGSAGAGTCVSERKW